jgi:peroxiredoxin
VSRRYGSVLAHADAELSARNTFLIAPDGKVARRWLKVTPDGHAEELLAALDAAGATKP